jgi:PAS domain S-box-containing protein
MQPELSAGHGPAPNELLGLLIAGLEEPVIVLCGRSGIFESWHAGVWKQFGYSAEEFIGQGMDLLEVIGDPQAVAHELQEAERVGQFRQARFLKRKDGSCLEVQMVTTALRGANGTLEGFGRILSGATPEMERKLDLSNERFRQIAAELERSNEELEEFARIASHDLSAPITTARWLTDLLASRHAQQLDHDGMTCLRQLSASLERMSDLIDAVLAHALAGKGAIAAQREADADAALGAAIENLRRDIATSGATLEHEPLPKLQIQPQALTQLFQNLLSNAIKYHRPGVPPRVAIKAFREGDNWKIQVRDNGLGIERDWFERIFLPLQRRHGAHIKGSGIGLATCKKIVSRAGGEIWVESEPGSGSEFYFSLPCADEQ